MTVETLTVDIPVEGPEEDFVSPGDRFPPTRPSKFAWGVGALLLLAFSLFVLSQDVNSIGNESASGAPVTQNNQE